MHISEWLNLTLRTNLKESAIINTRTPWWWHSGSVEACSRSCICRVYISLHVGLSWQIECCVVHIKTNWSRDSSVGIATRYGLDGPGIESRWDEIFRTYPDRLRGPPSLLYNRYRVFPGGKGGRGVILTTHPLLVPSWDVSPLTLWVLLGLLWGSLYLFH
jgi:hypothetical protein